MEMKALEDVFLHEIAELYDVEQRLVKALPKMAKAANSSALKAAFETHNKQTQHHADRLEKIFKMLGHDPVTRECAPMAELVRQGEEVIAMKTAEPEVRDAAMIIVGQRVEHYEIASYGSARAHANTLGYTKIAGILDDTLDEEKEADELLSQIATKRVNLQAAKAPFAQARTGARHGETRGGGASFGGLLSGVLIGAAIALLYAPKSGKSIRQDLREAADDLRQKSEEWRNSAEHLIERGRQTINEQRNKYANQ